MSEPKNNPIDPPKPPPAPEPEPTPVEEPTDPLAPPPEKLRLDPTRYGDWELAGKCVDF